MFNFLIRPESNYSFKLVVLYVLLGIYLFSPWGLWLLSKSKFPPSTLRTLIITVLSFVFIIFFIVSLKNPVGLHWFLLFVPYMYILFIYLDEKSLKKLFKYNYIFSLLHGVLLMAIVLLPTAMFKEHKQYSTIVYVTQPDEICKVLDNYTDKQLFTLGYTSASILAYQCKRDLHMLFNTSKFGRMDDALLNVKELDGKDITVFDSHPIQQRAFSNVCTSLNVRSFVVQGADFYLATCQQFSYPRYKAIYLETIRQKIYNIPAWLPQGQCYFEDMYYR